MSAFETPWLPLASRLESFRILWWFGFCFSGSLLVPSSCWSSWDMNPIETDQWYESIYIANKWNEWNKFKTFPQLFVTAHRWRGRPWGQWRPPRSGCCCWAWRPSPSSPRAWFAPDPWPLSSHPMVIIFTQGALWTDWPHLMRWYLVAMATWCNDDRGCEVWADPGSWHLASLLSRTVSSNSNLSSSYSKSLVTFK